MVTAGPYWQYVLYQKVQFMTLWDEGRQSFKGTKEAKRKYAELFCSAFGKKLYELGSDDSDAALTNMRNIYLDYLSHQK